MDGIGNGRERGNVGCGSRAKLSRSMVLFRPVKRRYSSADWTEPRNIWRKLARRMKISLALVVLSLFAINAAFAAPAATAPAADLSSPLGALRAYDQALPAGGIKAAISAYQASNPREQQAAEAMAQADLAGAQIELLARQKFGEKAAREVIHAMRQTSPSDFDTAHVKLAGDKATILWSDDRDPLAMVKVDGKWKVSVADLLGDDQDSLQDLVDTNQAIAKEFQQTARELEQGQYANAYLLERAIKQRLFRVLGEDD